MSDAGRVFQVPVAISEQKRLRTMLGEVQTVRVVADIFGAAKLVRGKGEMSIWFTNDVRHIPVQARIISDMGTLELKLKSRNIPARPSASTAAL